MGNRDFAEFLEVMRDARDTIGQGDQYTEGALDLMFAALADLSLSQIKQALVDHINDKINGKWRPNASYIRAQVERRTGAQWLGANEAWGRISKPGTAVKFTRKDDWGRDITVRDYGAAEPAPCVMNQQMADALLIAQPDIDAGDMVAARVIFISTYERLVEVEKVAGRAPLYWVSPGGSFEEQAAVREEGIRLGLLKDTWKLPAAPQLGHSTPPAGALEALHGFSLKSLPPPEAE